MSYQVLARKWRPRSFREMVGQAHVLKALISALDTGRLHHAYLFTGTRGVGKTTIARIMAKCLNCEQGVTSTPCGECSVCREIDEGRFVDLIEVDAASKTKVEDTRELLDNVQYMPGRGRYKVYLIDEVHMLSTSSFNALLKTLEEPPAHVKFLLATTDPQKLPATVLSRCLQFSLKNMPPEAVVGHLSHVLGQENIPFDEQALWLLGRAADGSMRDAMSLTDQAVAFGQGKVLAEDVRAMLGTLDQGQVFGVLQALVDGDAAAMLQAIRQLADHGPDWMGVLGELLGVLHRITVAQLLPDAVDNAQGDREQILQLARALPAEDTQFYYQVALMGRRDLPLSPDARDGFEMVMLRMLAFRPASLPGTPSPRLQLAAATVADAQTPARPASMCADAAVASSVPAANETPATLEPGKPTTAPAEQSAEAAVTAASSTIRASETSTQLPVGAQQSAQASSATAEPVPVSEPVVPTAIVAQKGPDADNATALPASTTPAAAALVDADAPAPWEDLPAEQPIPVAHATGVVTAEEPPLSSATDSPENVPPVAPTPEPATIAAPAPAPAPAAEQPSAIAAAAADEQDTSEDELLAEQQALMGSYNSWQPQADELASLQQQQDADSIDLKPHIPPASGLAARWIELCEQMALTGMTGNIVRNSTLVSEEGDHWCVHLDPQQSSLFTAAQQKRINDSVNQTLGREVQLQIEKVEPVSETPALNLARRRARQQADAVASIEQDAGVQSLMREFGAHVLPDSIRPHNPL
ncbi:MAG: DNA polymerase III subunit gamma/tau [Thiopseudomonas sp.]|nr:DNA polymerase III subunit gamma/tau [Thiopseudomonas sp.]